ncbi:hypothetical protein ACHAQI_012213 [Fusarium lateritium]
MLVLSLFAFLLLWIRIRAAATVYFWSTSNTCAVGQAAYGLNIPEGGACVPGPLDANGQFASAMIRTGPTTLRLRIWTNIGTKRCAVPAAVGKTVKSCLRPTAGKRITGASIITTKATKDDEASKLAPHKFKSQLTDEDPRVVAYAMTDEHGILHELFAESEHFASFRLLETDEEKLAYISKYADHRTLVSGMDLNTEAADL